MGSPRRLRKKYERPKEMWDIARIKEDHALVEAYALKNESELWKVQSEIRRIRRNVREILSGKLREEVGKEIIRRLARLGIVNEESSLEALFELKPEQFLERRLQTLVFKKGLASSLKQARQLITHGFISIKGVKARIPGYLVKKDEESMIGYYKPIEIVTKAKGNEAGSNG
ncbi:MAG: 30S ribosomal protein S4 [Candidatus Micrarchaeaceae archaeon]